MLDFFDWKRKKGVFELGEFLSFGIKIDFLTGKPIISKPSMVAFFAQKVPMVNLIFLNAERTYFTGKFSKFMYRSRTLENIKHEKRKRN